MEDCISFFNAFLKTELKPLMKKNGFKTSGQHFYIEKDKFIQFISIEKSSWNMKNEFTFWFNTSIFDKVAHKYLQEYSSIPKIPHHTLFNIIHTSVSAIKGISDRLSITTNSNPDEFKTQVFTQLETILIPFVESFQTEQDLINIYENPPEGYIGSGIFRDIAIGFHKIDAGNRSEGIEYIENWIENERKRGYWINAVNSLESKLKNGEI
jgi:bisphosphoglycerate-dependent phosphoglycerate mutase